MPIEMNTLVRADGQHRMKRREPGRTLCIAATLLYLLIVQAAKGRLFR